MVKIKVQVRKNKKAMFFLTVWGFHTITFMILIASISWFGYYILGLSSLEIGIIMMLSGSLRALVRFSVFKPTVKKLGENLSIKVGLGLFVIAFVLVGFSTTLPLFIFSFMIVSFAASLTRGLLNSKISKSVSPKEQGKINGLSSSLDSMSQMIGPIVGPTMLGFVAIGLIDLYTIGFSLAILGVIPFIMTLRNGFMKENIDFEN